MTISSFCHEQLRTQGPLALDVLARLAVAEGVTTSRTPEASVRGALIHNAVELRDKRWASPLALLEGRWLTTRRYGSTWYGEEPASHDLAPLHLAVRAEDIPLATGGVLKRGSYGYGWKAPDRWPGLDCHEGQLLSLHVEGGVLHVEVIDETPAVRARGNAFALAVGRLEERGSTWYSGSRAVSENLQKRIWELLAGESAVLTEPASPLSECVPALAAALKAEWDAHREAERHWRPTLDLSADHQDIAMAAARDADVLVHEWLNDFVDRSLLALETGTMWQPLYDERVRPLRRRI
ncbi:MAG: hypothetical protein QOJ79_3472 [Actinomycetota bacterium]|jgi:hypothetical protein|nr:hypothetical protein [Actinomycetota bacterium]